MIDWQAKYEAEAKAREKAEARVKALESSTKELDASVRKLHVTSNFREALREAGVPATALEDAAMLLEIEATDVDFDRGRVRGAKLKGRNYTTTADLARAFLEASPWYLPRDESGNGSTSREATSPAELLELGLNQLENGTARRTDWRDLPPDQIGNLAYDPDSMSPTELAELGLRQSELRDAAERGRRKVGQ